MKTALLKLRKEAIALCAGLLCFVALGFGQATVTTDKLEYYPGDTLFIIGSGWQPGETVRLHIDEIPARCPHGHNLYAVADNQGNIYNKQFIYNR